MSDENNKKSTLDTIIMGAIIGTAIGSAVGLSVAPKKGSETRDLAKETATGMFKFGKALVGKLFKKAKNSLKAEDMKKIPHEMEIIPKADKNHD